MLLLVTYDVNTEHEDGKKRLRHVAKICEEYGIRVQYSVFECQVDATTSVVLKSRLLSEISMTHDSLRFYNIGNNYRNKREHFGAKPAIDVTDPLIV